VPLVEGYGCHALVSAFVKAHCNSSLWYRPFLDMREVFRYREQFVIRIEANLDMPKRATRAFLVADRKEVSMAAARWECTVTPNAVEVRQLATFHWVIDRSA
jgi:hypothetical protein